MKINVGFFVAGVAYIALIVGMTIGAVMYSDQYSLWLPGKMLVVVGVPFLLGLCSLKEEERPE